jgi:hypothetical protein
MTYEEFEQGFSIVFLVVMLLVFLGYALPKGIKAHHKLYTKK